MQNFGVELFVRGLVLCLLTALALILFRRTAAAHRHLVCVVALLGLLALPWAQRLLPPLRLLPSRRAATPQRATVAPQEAGRLSGLNSKSERPASQKKPPEPIYATKPSALIGAGSGPAAQGRAPLSQG
jgi:hypothetical protein